MRALPCPPMMAELPSPALLGSAKRADPTFGCPSSNPSFTQRSAMGCGAGMRRRLTVLARYLLKVADQPSKFSRCVVVHGTHNPSLSEPRILTDSPGRLRR